MPDNILKNNIPYINVSTNNDSDDKNIINLNNQKYISNNLIDKNKIKYNDDILSNKINLINDLNINEKTKNFTYRGKNYYLYTPTNQIQKATIISYRCNIYRKNETDNKGKGNKLCYGTITYNKETKEIIFKTQHSNF